MYCIVIRLLMNVNRFLFIQIYNEARKFAQGSIIKCCQLYGGTASRHQNNAINVSWFENVVSEIVSTFFWVIYVIEVAILSEFIWTLHH